MHARVTSERDLASGDSRVMLRNRRQESVQRLAGNTADELEAMRTSLRPSFPPSPHLLAGLGFFLAAFLVGLWLSTGIHESHEKMDLARCRVHHIELPVCSTSVAIEHGGRLARTGPAEPRLSEVCTAGYVLPVWLNMTVSMPGDGIAIQVYTVTLVPVPQTALLCTSVAACLEQFHLHGTHVLCLHSWTDLERVHIAEYSHLYTDRHESEDALRNARILGILSLVPLLSLAGMYFIWSSLAQARIICSDLPCVRGGQAAEP